MKQALKNEGREDILVVVGGVVPPSDVEKLHQMGASAVFGPGTKISVAANKLINIIRKQWAS